MNRRHFMQVVGTAALGYGAAHSAEACQGDAVVAQVEIDEKLIDGDRGAVRYSGEVIRIPDSFTQVDVSVAFQDAEGETTFTMQEARERPLTADKWHFTGSFFGDAERVREIEQVSASVEVHE